MVNRIKRDVLLAIIAEWLEEGDIPPMIPRNQSNKEPINLKRILAIVGPRRVGNGSLQFRFARPGQNVN